METRQNDAHAAVRRIEDGALIGDLPIRGRYVEQAVQLSAGADENCISRWRGLTMARSSWFTTVRPTRGFSFPLM